MISINLSLTPVEEQQAKEVFAEEGMTLDEAVLSFVYEKLSQNKALEFPEMVEPKTDPIKMQSNGNGGFVFPDNTPAHVKELLQHAEQNDVDVAGLDKRLISFVDVSGYEQFNLQEMVKTADYLGELSARDSRGLIAKYNEFHS